MDTQRIHIVAYIPYEPARAKSFCGAVLREGAIYDTAKVTYAKLHAGAKIYYARKRVRGRSTLHHIRNYKEQLCEDCLSSADYHLSLLANVP